MSSTFLSMAHIWRIVQSVIGLWLVLLIRDSFTLPIDTLNMTLLLRLIV